MRIVDSDYVYLLTIYDSQDCILGNRVYASEMKAIKDIEAGKVVVYSIKDWNLYILDKRVTFKRTDLEFGTTTMEVYLDGSKFLGHYRIEMVDYEG